MTTVYDEKGNAQNVTVLDLSGNMTRLVKKADKNGYFSVQLGIMKDRLARKEGQEKERAKKFAKNFFGIKEFRFKDEQEFEAFSKLEKIDVTQFEKGDKLKLIGVSKGKGFQGVVKRHGFAGSPASHGHRHDNRAPGSIGCAFPERVFPGKRMAGRMGSKRVTVNNLEVCLVDEKNNYLAVKGAVPGFAGSLVSLISK